MVAFQKTDEESTVEKTSWLLAAHQQTAEGGLWGFEQVSKCQGDVRLRNLDILAAEGQGQHLHLNLK